jgi:hypothetical protein
LRLKIEQKFQQNKIFRKWIGMSKLPARLKQKKISKHNKRLKKCNLSTTFKTKKKFEKKGKKIE